MARAKQPKQIHQMTIKQFEEMFPDEDACDALSGGEPLARWRALPALRQRSASTNSRP